nr:hypothetical protein [Tanacetum cinerariifolium]
MGAKSCHSAAIKHLLTIASFFNKLKRCWDELQNLKGLPTCNCGKMRECTCSVIEKFIERDSNSKHIQFLMKLSDGYEFVRSQILATDPLPRVNKAYYIVQQIEKQKQVINHAFEPTAFFVSMNNKGGNSSKRDADSKDRPPMLAPGNYVKWKSRIKRYIDTKPNHELIHYCLKNPPYKLAWADKEVSISEGSPETTTVRYMETYKNVSQDIRNQLNAEAEAVQIILTWIDNDIYSTVDACPNACEMWKSIERLKQGESINVQDLKTNLYWEFRKFTSHDGESVESYYSSF